MLRVPWQGKMRNVLDESLTSDGDKKFLVELDFGLRAWLPQSLVGKDFFSRRASSSSILVRENFYSDPEAVRQFALEQSYEDDLRYFKGLRSTNRYLWPHLREEFEDMLRANITDWLDQPANGVFQKTCSSDPIVWHADHQNYAAAIYLTPGAPPSAGTSFWRDRQNKCRRPPEHELEAERFDAGSAPASSEIFAREKILSPDFWELVDSVGSIFNRLVIWDAQMIHSATSYADFDGVNPRLVQLFFFNVKK